MNMNNKVIFLGIILLSGISATRSPLEEYDSQFQDNDENTPNHLSQSHPPSQMIQSHHLPLNLSKSSQPQQPLAETQNLHRQLPQQLPPETRNLHYPQTQHLSQEIQSRHPPSKLIQPQYLPLNLPKPSQPQQLSAETHNIHRPQPQHLSPAIKNLNRSQNQKVSPEIQNFHRPQRQNINRHVKTKNNHRRQQSRLQVQQRNPLKIQPPAQIHQHHEQEQNSQHPQRNAESIKFIGPHNIPDHYFDLRWMAKSTNKSLLDAIKDTYNIRPIVRDLDLSRMDDKEIFTVVMKREIAWSHPELNEFGLMRCEELKFRHSPFAGYIELVPDGRRISIHKFDDSVSYQRASQASKEFQNSCLMKALEKTKTPSPSPASLASATQPGNCKTQIPFCFSDSWRQIWWKIIE
jgi:hypothetical protein